jgi:retron-type reverse transcriptase
LPQGACTSPALSNLAARALDARLTGLARKHGWDFTRYADDLTFSTTGEPAQKTAWILASLRHIAQEESFTVNEKKTRVQRQNKQQTVTGIVVNQRPNISRETIRRLRAILHKAKTEGLAAQNHDHHPHFASWVRGMIAYVQMVNPERGQKLKTEFDSLPV